MTFNEKIMVINKEINEELANDLRNKYPEHYSIIDFEIIVESVENSIKDLQGVCDLEDLHENIIANYI